MDDATFNLETAMHTIGRKAREGAEALRLAPAEHRTAAIHAMAARLRANASAILDANAEDVPAARAAARPRR